MIAGEGGHATFASKVSTVRGLEIENRQISHAELKDRASVRLSLKIFVVLLLAFALPAGAWADTASFSYTGAVQSWTVPAGVNSATFTLSGGSGADYDPGYGGLGGNGARVTATLPVVPGESLSIYVGGEGLFGSVSGRFGGGGAGNGNGAGGGGATDVRRGTSLADRLLVAGGGGGAGAVRGTYGGDRTAYKGGDSGHAAPEGGFTQSGRSGKPGTDTRPGFGGYGSGISGGPGAGVGGSDGLLGQGGAGGIGTDSQQDGGGGGGGVYGGGGGAGGYLTEAGGVMYTIPAFGGGGGGSKTAGGTLVDGANDGYGKAVITYSPVVPGVTPPSIAIASPADGASYTQGQTVAAAYACSAPASTTVTTCAGPVGSGAPIDTSTPGSYTFLVSAQDGDGGSATKTTTYTVAAGTPPPPTATPPTVSGASETAKTWRENDTLPHISAKRTPPIGTTFSFALNESATVTLSFTRQAAGRRVHRRCAAPNAKTRRKPRCTRTIVVGGLTFTGHPGTNQVRFAGRISPTSKLKPGRYTLRITATTAQRKRSSPQSLTFTIVK
jgi:hypothetical protein